MKNRFLLLFLLVGPTIWCVGRDVDTLDLYQCYSLARNNAPKLGLIDVYQKAGEITDRKFTSENMPQVAAFGKAWYQSDAMGMDLQIGDFNGMQIDNFQYNTGININQKIYNGGLVNIQKEINALEIEIKKMETEAALDKLDELVNAYFFGIKKLEKSLAIIRLKSDVLEERKKSIASAVENGVVLKSELLSVESEVILTDQQMIEIEFGKKQLKNSLLVLVGKESNHKVAFLMPDEILVPDSINRIENELYATNRELLESMKQFQVARYKPVLSAYGQAGYSYPGLNYFENQSDAFYIVGAKLSWSIFDWRQGRKEKQLLELQKKQVNIAEADFNRNLNTELQNQLDEIEMLTELIKSDALIVASKEKVAQISASKFENGTLTASDYLDDLNAELKARIDGENHKVRLLEAKAKLSVVMGFDTKTINQ